MMHNNKKLEESLAKRNLQKKTAKLSKCAKSKVHTDLRTLEKIQLREMRSGAPTQYKPEYCDMLIEHCKTGFSVNSFGAVVGVAVSTLYVWCETYPMFKEAKEIAEVSRLYLNESNALKLANGKISGSAPMQTFILKNLGHGLRWREKEIEEIVNSTGAIHIHFEQVDDVKIEDVL